MNVLRNNNIKGKFPHFYEYFTLIKPRVGTSPIIAIKKYCTNSYSCRRYYKNISIFSI